MALFRVTFAFAGERQGWTESYVFPGDDQLDPQTLRDTVIEPIAIARANLLAREYTLDAYRVAKFRLNDGTAVKRTVFLAQADLNPTLQTVANAGEQPRSCILCKATGSDGQGLKMVFMRGIPDEILGDGGEYKPNGATGWGSRFNSWAQLMLAGQWGWLEDQIVKANIEVVNYTINPNGTLTFQFGDDAFPTGDIGQVVPISVRGVNGGSRANGRHMMRIETEVVATTVKSLAVFPYSFGGVATRYATTKPFQQGGLLFPLEGRTHDTGRPSYATRGRQKAQARG